MNSLSVVPQLLSPQENSIELEKIPDRRGPPVARFPVSFAVLTFCRLIYSAIRPFRSVIQQMARLLHEFQEGAGLPRTPVARAHLDQGERRKIVMDKKGSNLRSETTETEGRNKRWLRNKTLQLIRAPSVRIAGCRRRIGLAAATRSAVGPIAVRDAQNRPAVLAINQREPAPDVLALRHLIARG